MRYIREEVHGVPQKDNDFDSYPYTYLALPYFRVSFWMVLEFEVKSVSGRGAAGLSKIGALIIRVVFCGASCYN